MDLGYIKMIRSIEALVGLTNTGKKELALANDTDEKFNFEAQLRKK